MPARNEPRQTAVRAPRAAAGDGDAGAPAAQPAFLITIDTEGDDLWSAPREITTRNAAFLPRFQTLCERFGLKPTWLTNWEMVESPVFAEFARDALRRDAAEVGMHLHAWNSPPLAPRTSDDFAHLPYLIEYPEPVMREKVRVLTETLAERFERPMCSHRAGRWALNETYARLLIEHGYLTDCSVTPHVSWAAQRGAPDGAGGTDYRGFPEAAYFLDPQDIRRAGGSPLLEVPMTIVPNDAAPFAGFLRTVGRVVPPAARLARRLAPEYEWLRPNGRNGGALRRIVAAARDEGRQYAEFMLHSSELMPGGSPTFRSARSIERLYEDLEDLFEYAASLGFVGRTLGEFRKTFRA
ncbi:MAG: deacetylase [Phycisphaerae bacterium]